MKKKSNIKCTNQHCLSNDDAIILKLKGIVKNGSSKSKIGNKVQRYLCHDCGTTFRLSSKKKKIFERRGRKVKWLGNEKREYKFQSHGTFVKLAEELSKHSRKDFYSIVEEYSGLDKKKFCEAIEKGENIIKCHDLYTDVMDILDKKLNNFMEKKRAQDKPFRYGANYYSKTSTRLHYLYMRSLLVNIWPDIIPRSKKWYIPYISS